MAAFTTAVNSTFAFIIAAAYLLGGHGISGKLGLNLFFYIIITPILTTTLMKLAYAREAQLQVKDALMRMDSLMARKPLPEPLQGELPNDSSLSMIKGSRRNLPSYGGAAASNGAVEILAITLYFSMFQTFKIVYNKA